MRQVTAFRAHCFMSVFVLLVAAIIAVSLICENASAEPMTLNNAINKAGRQRMLSQRIAKAYCQIGLNTRRDEAAKELEQSVRLFDAQFAELNEFAPNPKISDALATVKMKWAPFKAMVTKPYSRENVVRLVDLNEELLQAAHNVVLRLQEHSGRPMGRLVNIAGRQRMLSQRLAKFYMLRQAGVQQTEIADNLEQVYNEFSGAHNELRAASQNTTEINRRLSNVNIQWELLKQSLKETNRQHDLSELVVLTTDKILREMDTVTGLYEAIP